MEQPEAYGDGSNRVCKLNRSIYGLKQAGRQWNINLDAALRKFGLKKSKRDPCIYYSGDLRLLIAIYVDDFLIFYKNDLQERFLQEVFEQNLQNEGSRASKQSLACVYVKGIIALKSINRIMYTKFWVDLEWTTVSQWPHQLKRALNCHHRW